MAIEGATSTQQRPKKRIGEKLIEAGLINERQLSVALGMQKQTGLKIGQQLMKLGFIKEEELTVFLLETTDTSVPLTKMKITENAVKAVPKDIAFKYKVMPIAHAGKTVVMAMTDPSDLKTLDLLTFHLGRNIHPVKALEWDIDNALLKYYLFFSDEEIAKLTNVSTVAEQYKRTHGEEDIAPSASMGSETPASISPEPEESFADTMPEETEAEDWTDEPEGLQSEPPEIDKKPAAVKSETSQSETAEPPIWPPRRVVAPAEGFTLEPTHYVERAKAPETAAPPKTEWPAPQRPEAPQAPPSPPASDLNGSAPAKAASARSEKVAKTVIDTFTPPVIHRAIIELLLEKGVISEKELIDKLTRMVRESL